jgi:hypothetical protein
MTMLATIRTIDAAGRVLTSKVHAPYAWYAARGIAVWSHAQVILTGRYGVATFHPDGSGSVQWNAASDSPGEIATFCPGTTVCIL